MEMENHHHHHYHHHEASAMEFPRHFRCPISMEHMKDPVTISTGVTYERKNIEKWFYTYNKKTCPATMQSVGSFDMTPNHTLVRLIQTWQNAHQARHESSSSSPPPSAPIKRDELVSLMKNIDSTPFKVTCLKKLRSMLEAGAQVKADFIRSGGVELLIKIITQILAESSDFVAFRACEEALAVLQQLPFSSGEDDEIVELLMKPECLKSMAIILQRGSAEARFCVVSMFQKMAKADYHWKYLVQNQGIDFFKSLFEIVSDEICTKASSCALQVLIEILQASKKSRLKAIEAGAVCTLIELLPDSNPSSKCEKIMFLLKLLCECADGRLAFTEHALGIAAISKKLLNVSNTATKIGVKILWLICNFHPTEKVLEEMLLFGAVKKLGVLLHISGQSSTKDRVVKIFKLHRNSWARHHCFPREMKEYLGLGSDFY